MEQLLLSIKKATPNSASSSEDNNRSTVKRLFSSVFSLIDNDQEISHFDPQQQPSRIEKLLQNPTFVNHLLLKLRNEGLCDGYTLPIITFSLQMTHPPAPNHKIELDYDDIVKVFTKFGQMNKVVMLPQNAQAYIFFNSFLNAYICYKTLGQLRLRGGSLQICVEWLNCREMHYPDLHSEVNMFINGVNWQTMFDSMRVEEEPTSKQNKYTCRYDIQIENEREFQVARRIIGSKGCNMKRILEESIISNNQNKNYSNENPNELLKLRLRGKGSGYKQGPQQMESSQNLHLCVSAKDELIYNAACWKVEQLLDIIYREYAEWNKRQGKNIELKVQKSLIGQNNDQASVAGYPQPATTPSGYNYQYNQNYRISPQKIGQLLELRNKARRELNFTQADRIRNYLRNCGVCLIDEKGRRGRATEVTTWKYLY